MNLSQKQRIFAILIARLITWAYSKGYEVVIGEVQRTKEQQEVYLRTGASKSSNSKHLVACAADLSLFLDGGWIIAIDKPQVYVIDGSYTKDPEKYRPLGEYWESLGPEYGVKTIWGGRFGLEFSEYQTKIGWDAGHFEVA